MTLEIKVLDLGDIDLESSFLVLGRMPGTTVRVPTFGYLILGDEDPVLVDTGYRWHRTGVRSEEQSLENQLAKYGIRFGDIHYILHTHLHIDHAGQDDKFPMSTPVVVNRRELEFSASGLQGRMYPPEDVKHLIDRLHTPGALRLLDLELTGPIEIVPGIRCDQVGGHTPGSMNVLVETEEGTACICGDVVYDIQHQIVDPFAEVLDAEPTPTGNHAADKREVRAAIKKVVDNYAFVCPTHDRPARVERGKVVGRLRDSVPGVVTPVEGATSGRA